MKQIGDFEVMASMAEKDMDIGMMPTIVSMQTTKQGGHVTIGVPHGVVEKITSAHYTPVFYVVNFKQFESEKARFEKSALSEDEVVACRDLISRLVRRVSDMIMGEEELEDCGWRSEEGVLMSGNECRLLLKALRFGTESPFNLK